jgi:TPR repeat protein
LYANGQGVPQDYKEAIKWYRLAAEQGDSDAQGNLGVFYEKGQGVPQDYEEAVKWFRLAANQGDADAQHRLGVMYNDGQGVHQDYKEAIKWYRLAASNGNASAQFNLALMYAKGKHIAKDYKEAVKWSRLAADQSHAAAQGLLGIMYEYGQGGVSPNRVVACALYMLSAASDPSTENGVTATANKLKLVPRMSSREIDAAQDLMREMAKPKNLLLALSRYLRNPKVKAGDNGPGSAGKGPN